MKKMGVILLILVLIFSFAGCTNDHSLKKANDIADELTTVITKYIDETSNLDNLTIEITLTGKDKTKTFPVEMIPIDDKTTTADISNYLSGYLYEYIENENLTTFKSATIRRGDRISAEIDKSYKLTIFPMFDLGI